MKVIKNKTCRVCRSEKLKDVIDFGEHPLVNSLVEEKDLDKVDETLPLVVSQCQDCFLVQIANIVDSHEIYQAQDYLYFTGDMPASSQYIKAFDQLETDLKALLNDGDFMVEIGSNDGFVLGRFKKNYKVLGVEPSINVAIRALSRGVPTLSASFDEHNAKNIAKEYGKASAIGGANCLAHINDLHGVLRGVDALLADDGVFWVECNYWGGMVKSKHYALIYHDHYSYFTLDSWRRVLTEYGLEVFDAYVTEAQGDGLSLRLYARRRGKEKPTDRCLALAKEESETKLNSLATVEKYDKEIREEAIKLRRLIDSLKNEGKSIAGYGAAAKGFSVSKFAGIDVEYFVDDSPAKQGKYTPVTHTPIISRKEAESRLPDYFFITAPNYESVIIEKEGNFVKNGGKFITVKSEIK